MSITVYTHGEWDEQDWLDYSGIQSDMEFTMPDGRVLNYEEFAEELISRAECGAVKRIDGWDRARIGEEPSGNSAADFAILVERGIPFEIVELPDDPDDAE
jgi:hypothetical protein